MRENSYSTTRFLYPPFSTAKNSAKGTERSGVRHRRRTNDAPRERGRLGLAMPARLHAPGPEREPRTPAMGARGAARAAPDVQRLQILRHHVSRAGAAGAGGI